MKRIEETHRNLGLPTVLAKIIDLSDWGLLIVASRGQGKGAVLNSIEQLRHRKVMEVSRLTPAGLKRIADELSGAEVTFINPDISTLYNPYLKDAMINCMAHLISEHKLPKSWTDRYEYSIENCKISFLSGVQPKMMKAITQLPQWESMYKDRFIRIYLYYPLGTPQWREKYPNVGEIYLPDFSVEAVSIPESVKGNSKYHRLRAILERQTSEGRAGAILNKMLKAHAYLNERESVIPADLDFLELFTLNLMTDYWLSTRLSLAGSLQFEPDSYVALFRLIEKEEVTRRELQEYFKVSRQTLMRYLKPLIERNIIAGTYGQPTYKLNPEWKQKYIEPVKLWMKENLGLI
jgi:hypothetical protein